MTHRAPFRPAWWLPGSHLQTIAGRYLRRPRGIRLRRERIELPDCDFLNLDWPEIGNAGSLAAGGVRNRPLVLLLHGLEGCAASSYALQTYRALAAQGLGAVGLNFRSCGGEPNRNPRFYHAGDTADLGLVIQHLARRYSDAALGAIGFSLGANVLLKYLGEQGAKTPLQAAVAVSVPFDLAAGADRLERGFGKIYAGFFLRSLRRKVQARAGDLNEACDVPRSVGARSLRDFDDAATAPLHGFSGVNDYYRSSSSAGFLKRIRVPTLVLHALDDPFLPSRAIPREALTANPFITALLPPKGGHVGFIEGRFPWRPRFWAEDRAATFLRSHLRQSFARGGGGNDHSASSSAVRGALVS